MPINLPEPDRSPIAQAPIVLAVCQVRTGPNARAQDEEAVLAVYEALGGTGGPVPRLNPPTSQSLAQGPGGPSVTIQQPGWRFLSEDNGWTVLILPDSVSLETIAYATWDGDGGYYDLLSRLLDAVSHHLRPAAESRLGLRYVNQITTPAVTHAAAWKGYIDDRFLGPAADEGIGPGVEASDTRLLIDLGDGRKCQLRHGSFLDATRPGHLTYLIDMDCYREAETIWSLEAVKQTAVALNTDALRLFQAIARPELRALLNTGAEVSS